MLARALLDLLDERDRDMPPDRVRYPGPNFCHSAEFWPEEGGLPSLGLLPTRASFLIFNIGEVSDDQLREWWEAPVARWSDDPDSPNYKFAYKFTKVMASKLDVTNDNCESSLKGVKDTIGKYHSEEGFQHGLLTLFEDRKLAPAEKSGTISKRNLKYLRRRPDA